MKVLGWSEKLLDAKVSWNYFCDRSSSSVNHWGHIRSVRDSVIGVLSCLIECEDGNICEAKLDELCFEKREE